MSAYLHGFDLGPTSQWIVWLIRYGWKLVYIQLWYCWGEISRSGGCGGDAAGGVKDACA